MTKSVTRYLMTRTAGVLAAALLFFSIGIVAQAGGNLGVREGGACIGPHCGYAQGRITASGSTGEIDLQDRDSSTWSSTDRFVLYNSLDRLRFYSGSNNDVMALTHSGQLGIGTINPGYKLEVEGPAEVNDHGGTNFGLTIRSDASGYARVSLYDQGVQKSEMGLYSDNTFKLWHMNDYRITVDPSGNVGIGTTTPADKLDVQGNVRVSGNVVNFTLLQSDDINGRFRFGGCNSGVGNCISDAANPPINHATGDEDLYIEDDLEVDGKIYVGEDIEVTSATGGINSCTDASSGVSGTADDATVSVSCPTGYQLVGCSCLGHWKNCDGAYTSGGACYAQNGTIGKYVYAKARCCRL